MSLAIGQVFREESALLRSRTNESWQVKNGLNWVFQPIRNIIYPQPNAKACTTTVTSFVEETRLSEVKTVNCDGNRWLHACYHYSSVSRVQKLDTLVCPATAYNGDRDAVAKYRGERGGTKSTEWYKWVSNAPAGVKNNKCNRDEYPPFRFLAGPNDYKDAPQPANYDQWIRFLPESDNKGAQSLWNRLCGKPKKETKTEGGSINDKTCTEIQTITYRVNGMKMNFINVPDDIDDGMYQNWCTLVPTLRVDPGFNLLNEDEWFDGRGYQFRGFRPDYLYNPSILLTMGKTRPRSSPAKRSLEDQVVITELLIDEGNVTRKATPEELWEQQGLVKCGSENCEKEKMLLEALVSDAQVLPPEQIAAQAVSTASVEASLSSSSLPRKRPTAVGVVKTDSHQSPSEPTATEQEKRLSHRHSHHHMRHLRNSH